MSKRVFVAGHNGMVGASISRLLLKLNNIELITADRSELDLRDSRATSSFVQDTKPDAVILAAAKVGGILANSRSPERFLSENLQIQESVILASFQEGIKDFIFLGSSCIYPKHAEQPMKEESLLSGPLEKTNEAYAIAKIAGLKHVEYVRNLLGPGWVSVMPTNLYGPGDTYDREESHVIPALVLKIHEAKRLNSPTVELLGTGEPMREFLHVDDLASAIVKILLDGSRDAVINIGSGHEVSIRDLAYKICGLVGYEGELIFNSAFPDGTPRKLLDSSRINSLGWSPKVQLEDGLVQAYADFTRRESLDE